MKAPSPAPSALILAPGGARCERPAFLGFIGVCFCALVLAIGPFASTRSREAILPALVLASTLATLGHLAGRLPAQNVLAIALINAGGGLLGAGLAREGVVPLLCPGPSADAAFGSRPLQVLTATLLWITNVLGARAAAARLLRPWRHVPRYGFGLIGLTAVLATLGSALLVASSAAGLAGTFVLTVVQLVLCVPWMVDKRGLRHPATFQPAVTWLLTLATVRVVDAGG